jgi:hypothetical protein
VLIADIVEAVPVESRHGVPSPPLGCATADDGHPDGGTAPPAAAARHPGAVGVARRDAAPLPQSPKQRLFSTACFSA